MSRECADDGNGSMAKLDLPKWVMAAINFKGGTGKTTVALAIAEGICRLLKKRVAVIDCDFQCSASIALLGRRTLNDLIGRNATMDGLLQSKLTEGNGAHLGSSAVKTHFSIKEAAGLDAPSARQPRHAAAGTADRGVLPAPGPTCIRPTRPPRSRWESCSARCSTSSTSS